MQLKIDVDELAGELAERLDWHWGKKLRMLSYRVSVLEAEANLAWEQGDRLVAEMLNGNSKYQKTVDAFLDLRGYTKNWKGWRAACRCEPGLWKKTGNLARLQWPRFWKILLESRKMRRG